MTVPSGLPSKGARSCHTFHKNHSPFTIAKETARFHIEGCSREDPFANFGGSKQADDEATIEDE